MGDRWPNVLEVVRAGIRLGCAVSLLRSRFGRTWAVIFAGSSVLVVTLGVVGCDLVLEEHLRSVCIDIVDGVFVLRC